MLEQVYIGIPAFRSVFIWPCTDLGRPPRGGRGRCPPLPGWDRGLTVAMPGIANPGVLDAAVLLTDNTPLSLVEETGLTVGTVPIVLVALLTTHRSQRLLGNAVIRRRPAPRSWG